MNSPMKEANPQMNNISQNLKTQALNEHGLLNYKNIIYNQRPVDVEFPILGRRLIRDVLRIFALAANAQQGAFSDFGCTGDYLRRKYGCTLGHSTYLFNAVLESGFVVVTQEQNRALDINRRFQFIPSVAEEIDRYLQRQSQPPYEEEIILSPVLFTSSGMTVEDENDFLVELHQEQEEKKGIEQESQILKPVFTPRNPIDRPWKIVRDFFGSENYDYHEFNDCMAQIVENLEGDCQRAREFLEPMYQAIDGHTAHGRQELFVQLCRRHKIYPRIK